MSIPEPFTGLLERMQQRFVGDVMVTSPNQTVEKVVSELPEDVVLEIVADLCELQVTFWTHGDAAHSTTMQLLDPDMPMEHLRRRLVDFFGHFLAMDDEVAYLGKLRRPEWINPQLGSTHPFGVAELPFGLPGYNC